MARKIDKRLRGKSVGEQKRPARKAQTRRKSSPAKKSVRSSKRPSTEDPALAMIRPPAPGQGKRGERGYLAYLLRQAQAATRLTMERALASLGVTTPQFVVLTMLRAYPSSVRCRSRPGGGFDPANRRHHHPQSRARRRDPEDAAPDPWPGTAVDADPARPELCWTNAAATSWRWNGDWRRGSAPGRNSRSDAGCPKSPQTCRIADPRCLPFWCRPAPPLDWPDETA